MPLVAIPVLAATPVFHPLVGREDCLGCHSSARVGAALMPVDHVLEEGPACITCHARVGGPMLAVYGGGGVAAVVFAIGAVVLWRRIRPRARAVEVRGG